MITLVATRTRSTGQPGSQATLRMRRPFTLPESFVERELGGRPGGKPVCPRC
jgi:hypothetical protein